MSSTKIPVPIKNISCQELLLYSDIVIHGFLRRRPALNKFVENISKSVQLLKWPNSYVVLRDGCLYVYKHEKSLVVVKASSLYGFTEVSRCDPSEVSTAVSWAFKVTSELDYRNSVFYFSAVTENEMKKWMSCIQQQMDYANNSCSRPETRTSSSYTDGMSWPSSGNQAASGVSQPKPVAAKPKRSPAPYVDLEYEIETDSDSDYDLIEEEKKSGNVTDDFKDKQKRVGDEITQQFNTQRIKLPYPEPKSGITSPGLKKPPELGAATGQLPPKTGPKPAKPLPQQPDQNPALQRKSPYDNKPPLTGKRSVDSGNFQPGYYAVQGLIEADEMPMYVASDSYPAFSGPPKATSKTEPVVEEAYWRGTKTEGEKLMKTLPNGVYMIRASSEAGGETLMVRGDLQVQKYHVLTTPDGLYSLAASGPAFDSRTDVISYYRSNYLPGRSIKLTVPYTNYSPAK